MKRPYPSNEHVDIISSDDSSSSDAEMEVTTEYDGKQLITSEGALMRRAEMYQEYMKHIPIPTHRGSIIPFTSWMGLVTTNSGPWMPSFILVKPRPPYGSLKKFTETPHLIIM
ncbi:hypothetical protein ACLB2K_041100 [Fragaria x ananassa]